MNTCGSLSLTVGETGASINCEINDPKSKFRRNSEFIEKFNSPSMEMVLRPSESLALVFSLNTFEMWTL